MRNGLQQLGGESLAQLQAVFEQVALRAVVLRYGDEVTATDVREAVRERFGRMVRPLWEPAVEVAACIEHAARFPVRTTSQAFGTAADALAGQGLARDVLTAPGAQRLDPAAPRDAWSDIAEDR